MIPFNGRPVDFAWALKTGITGWIIHASSGHDAIRHSEIPPRRARTDRDLIQSETDCS
jgi:hypothetical protein